MASLSFDEWVKLPEKEKGIRFEEMSSKDRHRWRVTCPIVGEVIYTPELSRSEKIRHETEALDFMLRKGIISPEERETEFEKFMYELDN